MAAVDSSPATGRSAAGSRTADLHANHCSAILRYCRSRLPSQEDAEDATQIVFMNAYRGLTNGVEPRSEAAWLFKIAERVVLSRRRALARRARVEFATDGQELGMVSQGDPDGPRSDLSLLTDSLARIPDAQRRAIVLREWQGLPRQSIATELGVSVGAVEKLILRARRALTEDLDGGARRRLPALASVAAWLRRYLHAGGVAKSAAGAASVAVLAAGTAHVVLPAHTPSSHTPARGVPHARSAVRVSVGPEASSPASVNLGARHRRRAAHNGGRAATPAVVPSYSGPSIAADDVEPSSAAAVVPAAPPEALPPTPASASAPTAAAAVVADVPTDTAKAGADGPGRSKGNADSAPVQDVRLLAAAIAGDGPGSSDQPAPTDDQAPAASDALTTDGAPDQTDEPALSNDQAPPAAGPPANGQRKAKNTAVSTGANRPHDKLAS